MRPSEPQGREVHNSLSGILHCSIWVESAIFNPSPLYSTTQPGIDHTRMEVLQLTAMLVKYHHAILQDARKDIIKFGWTYIRLEDVINKHAAYVVIGYFIAHYETPAKIVQQVYFSLLKTNQNEGRALVTQALELMSEENHLSLATDSDFSLRQDDHPAGCPKSYCSTK